MEKVQGRLPPVLPILPDGGGSDEGKNQPGTGEEFLLPPAPGKNTAIDGTKPDQSAYTVQLGSPDTGPGPTGTDASYRPAHEDIRRDGMHPARPGTSAAAGLDRAYTVTLGGADRELSAFLESAYDRMGRSVRRRSEKTGIPSPVQRQNAVRQPVPQAEGKTGPGGDRLLPVPPEMPPPDPLPPDAPQDSAPDESPPGPDTGGTGQAAPLQEAGPMGRPAPPALTADVGEAAPAHDPPEAEGLTEPVRPAPPEVPGSAPSRLPAGIEAPEVPGSIEAPEVPGSIEPPALPDDAEMHAGGKQAAERPALPGNAEPRKESAGAQPGGRDQTPQNGLTPREADGKEAAAAPAREQREPFFPADASAAHGEKTRAHPYLWYLLAGAEGALPGKREEEESGGPKRVRPGRRDGRAPEECLTLSEVIAMAALLHSAYRGEEGPLKKDGLWYGACVEYAIAAGILREGEFPDCDGLATRAQTAYLFANALPKSELHPLGPAGLPAEVRRSEYGGSILLLCRAGILTGWGDEAGCRPDDCITRAEASAILERILTPARRKPPAFPPV